GVGKRSRGARARTADPRRRAAAMVRVAGLYTDAWAALERVREPADLAAVDDTVRRARAIMARAGAGSLR
ncbi:MAG: hypothetical protein WCA46_06245, partial [Actinocatenispora sp.]